METQDSVTTSVLSFVLGEIYKNEGRIKAARMKANSRLDGSAKLGCSVEREAAEDSKKFGIVNTMVTLFALNANKCCDSEHQCTVKWVGS